MSLFVKCEKKKREAAKTFKCNSNELLHFIFYKLQKSMHPFNTADQNKSNCRKKKSKIINKVVPESYRFQYSSYKMVSGSGRFQPHERST